MKLAPIDFAILAGYFALVARPRPLLRPAREAVDARLLPLEPLDAVVAGRDGDGRDDVLRRHAARRHRDGREERSRGQLAVVVDAAVRDAHRLLLREALAPRGRRHRRRARGAALLGKAGRVPSGVPRRLHGPARQHARHGLGQPRHVEGDRGHARHLPLAGPDRLPPADLRVHRRLRLLGRRREPRRPVPVRDGRRDRARRRLRAGGRRHRGDEGARSAPRIPPARRPGRRSARRTRSSRSGPSTSTRSGRCRRSRSPALLALNWWASWYPGAEPGGGGYVAQNMLACKDEKNSRAAALFFNLAHYALRSWPWVVTALCSLAILGGAVQERRRASRTRV